MILTMIAAAELKSGLGAGGAGEGKAVLGVADSFHENPEKSPAKFFNQSLIDPDQIFNHDPDHDEKFSIKVWLKIFNQSLLKIFQSGSGCKKLNNCT